MTQNSKEAVRYRAPALDKGLDILELLARSSDALTQIEVAKGLNRGPNEIYRMLDTLVRRGYVIRSQDGDKYLISLRLLVLADMHPPRRRLLDAAEPLMRKFSVASEQSVHLAAFEDNNVVVLSSFSAPGNWRFSLRTGSVLGLLNTASGLVLTTFKSEEDRKQLIRHYIPTNDEEVPEADKIAKYIKDIRATGHYIGESQAAVGVTDLAFPILDPAGNAIAVLTCPYLLRLDSKSTPSQEEVAEMLKESARALSQQLFGLSENP